MKDIIEQGLKLGVLEKKDTSYVISNAADRDQINTYVQFLLEEIEFVKIQNIIRKRSKFRL
jgi:1-deoxy-D-xylulose 5-phosphate reductoisomerase